MGRYDPIHQLEQDMQEVKRMLVGNAFDNLRGFNVSPGLLPRMREQQDRVDALAEYLGLEFYEEPSRPAQLKVKKVKKGK